MQSTQLIARMDSAHLSVPSALSQGVVPTEQLVCLCYQFPDWRRISQTEAATALNACGIPLVYLPSKNEFEG